MFNEMQSNLKKFEQELAAFCKEIDAFVEAKDNPLIGTTTLRLADSEGHVLVEDVLLLELSASPDHSEVLERIRQHWEDCTKGA